MVYPPPLLPASNWRHLMAGLEDHFGENAELDEESFAHIGAYLEAEVMAAVAAPSKMNEMLRILPDNPALRITEYPSFVTAHEIIEKQLEVETLREGFLSPCQDCHRQAEHGIFDKNLIHPGYGPAVWGRGKESPEQG
ncbi:MAG: hypothetical protein QF921_16810 [Pseudomonadales bacterium]|nr:hypothetical protein [Pseudomonadales bacterium]MDP6471124.1 hypothetical protein [Pseudomonadales bacterium]MDP6825690.1 hypothetical protein [Pseudomonadales bacterium]MDP6973146.1 hypothetical protein [Pseudomonadales bacterium]